MSEKKDKKRYYVDNDVLTEDILRWQKNIRHCEENDLPEPRMPESVGKAIIDTTTNLTKKYNFFGYGFKDEMAANAIETVVRYIKNFDIDAKTRTGKPNPFGYITQIAKFNFLTTIHEENKKRYVLLREMIENDFYMVDGTERHLEQSHPEFERIKEEHIKEFNHLKKVVYREKDNTEEDAENKETKETKEVPQWFFND